MIGSDVYNFVICGSVFNMDGDGHLQRKESYASMTSIISQLCYYNSVP